MTSLVPLSSISDVTYEWLSCILCAAMKKNLHVKSFSSSSDLNKSGFLSEVFMLNISTEEKETFSLVLKFLPKIGQMENFICNTDIGFKESAFYNFIMLENFQNIISCHDIILPLTKVYFAGNDSINNAFTLVMEDMSVKGYSTPVLLGGVGLEVTKRSFNAIAIIHACSYRYIEKYGFENVIHLQDNQAWGNEISDLIKTGLTTCASVLGSGSQYDKISTMITKNKHTELLSNNESSIPKTLIHGDFWSGQILYNEETKCVCVLDWQFVNISNPTDDLATFLFMSCALSYYKDNLKEVLSVYVKSLNKTLNTLGSCSIILFEDIYQSLQKSWKRGFMVLLMSVNTFLTHRIISKERLKEAILFADDINLFS